MTGQESSQVNQESGIFFEMFIYEVKNLAGSKKECKSENQELKKCQIENLCFG